MVKLEDILAVIVDEEGNIIEDTFLDHDNYDYIVEQTDGGNDVVLEGKPLKHTFQNTI